MADRFIRIRTSKDLPHWTTTDGTYFITFRLADSLPKTTPRRQRRTPEWLRVDRVLDQGYGAAVLRAPALAGVVEDALRYFDRQRYELHSWCVMPNHVHVVARIFGTDIDRVVHAWKSYTASRINAMTGRTGSLWQRDYFDYLIRDQAELSRICDYVKMNPRKARLQDWPFVWTSPEVGPVMD